MTKVQAGDVVHVRGRVAERETGIRVQFNDVDNFGNSLWINPDTIVHVEPRPPAIGDKVTWGTGAVNYIIRAIVDDRAMLQSSSTWTVWPLSDLRRAE